MSDLTDVLAVEPPLYCHEPEQGQNPDPQDSTTWPHTDWSTEDCNGRELGYMYIGMILGRARGGERYFLIEVDEPRVAAVSAAIVNRGWAVSRCSWGATTACLKVWDA